MAYEPHKRGPHPVGVQTTQFAVDDSRNLQVECWYPASSHCKGLDLSVDAQDRYEIAAGLPSARQKAARNAKAAKGPFPVIVFSHGMAGHRRQSTFLTTHLASHGFVVVAPDHEGDTVLDFLGQGRNLSFQSLLKRGIEVRPGDISQLSRHIEEVVPKESLVRTESIGAIGHSLGAWTILKCTSENQTIHAIVTLGAVGMGETILDIPVPTISTAWGRLVPALMVAPEKDTMVPTPTRNELKRWMPSPKREALIRDIDHFHFCDDAQRIHEMFQKIQERLHLLPAPFPSFSTLLQEKQSQPKICALVTAHCHAFMNGSNDAKAFLNAQDS